jgi:peptidoglycan/LPS O-acetylase OafA/YrhL
MSHGKQHIKALTSVRFFAALSVVLFHYAQHSIANAPEWLRTFVASGYLGVTLFFILSGFILVYVHHDDDFTARPGTRSFFVRRFARIYPVYFLAWLIAGVYFISTWIAPTTPLADAAKLVGLYGGLSATLLQGWVPTAAIMWNLPGWSLSAEAFFYAVFPFALVASSRLRVNTIWLLIVALVILNALALMLIELPFAHRKTIGLFFGFNVTWHTFLAYFPPLALAQFLMGMMLGRLYVLGQVPVMLTRYARTWATIAIIGIIVTLSIQLPQALRGAIAAPLFGLLILALANTQQSHRGTDLLVFLGASSYAIYILQNPLDWIFSSIGLNPYRDALLPYVASLLLLSMFVYKTIERPAERWIKQRFQRQPSSRLYGGEAIRNPV